MTDPKTLEGLYADHVRIVGTATAYDEAIVPLFATLDRMDAILAERRYLAGSRPTLADWRAFSRRLSTLGSRGVSAASVCATLSVRSAA